MADDSKDDVIKCPECPVCPPAGLPGWMATFSDMVTLLLTFFVLLLSFAKTETSKYEAVLGSIRNSFGGNVLKQGEVIQKGKSATDAPTMLESEDTVRPFPIDFLTMEGLLDKHEINRNSQENLTQMKRILKDYNLVHAVKIEEEDEGIKVKLKDFILFEEGSVKIKKIVIEVFERMIKLLKNEKWVIFIEGHSSKGEQGSGGIGPYELSSLRSMVVAKTLMRKGVPGEKITAVYYGDMRPLDRKRSSLNRRVEFTIRKKDLKTPGHRVDVQ